MRQPFQYLFRCDANQDDVQVRWKPDGFSPSEPAAAQTESAWRRMLEAARTEGRSLFDSALCRLDDWAASESGEIRLSLSQTFYSHLAATHFEPDSPLFSLNPEEKANALSVCSTVETADGKIAVQKRGGAAWRLPGFLHVCGGQMEPDMTDPQTGLPCPFAAIKSELLSELGIRDGDLQDLRLAGLFRDETTGQPECCFAAVLRLDAKQLMKQAAMASDAGETENLFFLPADPRVIERFLAEEKNSITPSGLAALARWIERAKA